MHAKMYKHVHSQSPLHIPPLHINRILVLILDNIPTNLNFTFNNVSRIKHRRKKNIVRKYWANQARKPAGQTPNYEIPCLMLKVSRGLFASSFADCDTLLGLVLSPSSRSLWHGSSSTNILGSPVHSRFYLHSFMQWPLWALWRTALPHIYHAFSDFP